MNINSLIFSTAAVLLWGVWGILLKQASVNLNPLNNLVFSGMGSLVVVLGSIALLGGKVDFSSSRSIVFSVLAGFIGTLAVLFFIYAVSKGRVSAVVPFTSLYPIVTVLLAVVLLGENISVRQIFGIGFALIALLLLSL